MARIGYTTNIASLQAQRSLSSSSSAFGRALERLSSGRRIHRASDDAAGLAISSRLSADVRTYSQGIRNLNDGLSMLNIAEGALTQLSSITMRLQELATQGANGTLGSGQRTAMNTEAQQLVSEFARLTGETSFNGLSLLDGTRGQVNLQAALSSIGFQLGTSLGRRVGTGGYGDFLTRGASVSGEGAVGDFDGDGLDDIVRAQGTGDATILFGDGGTYTFSGALASAGDLVRVGDINNDGRADIFFASTAEKVVDIALGDGSGGFSLSSMSLMNDNAQDFELADVNGDGNLDCIAVSSFGSRVDTHLGNGAGGFTSTSTVYGNFGQMSLGDLDGDGDIDLGVIEGGTGNILLYRNNGVGTFSNFQTLATSNNASTIELGDFDGDGRIDIAAGDSDWLYLSSQISPGIFGFFSKTDITSLPGGSPGALVSIKFTDVNNDGRVDLVASGIHYGVATFLGDGRGGIASAHVYDMGAGDQVSVGDFNGDGIIDIAVAGQNTDLRYAYGIAGFSTQLINVNLLTRAGSLSALDTLKAALERIAKEQSNIGASQSRLATASSVLFAARENFEMARNRIVDADVAAESAQLIRTQILRETGAAVLAQANQAPALALTLLRNGR